MSFDNRDYYKPSGFGGFSFFPPVLKKILIINAAVFIVQIIFQSIIIGGVNGSDFLTYWFALMPLSSGNFNIWQLITYQFMHGGFMHIFFNMFILWMFGMEIENMWGSKKFLLFYLACGIGAGLAQLFIAPMFGAVGPTIGASGAVFGVMIAFAMFFPDRYIFLWFLIPIKAKYLIAFMVVFEFLSVGNQSLVAHLAHVGGAITGFAFILYDRRKSINIDRMVSYLKNKFSKSSGNTGYGGTNRRTSSSGNQVEEAEFYDINDSSSSAKKSEPVNQEEIDKILDKISKSGYQNLTEREKKILFEASKKE